MQKHRLDETYAPVYDVVNPFYLCGDFDGDSIRDYAILLRPKGKKDPFSKIAVLRGDGHLNWLEDDLKERRSHPGPAWWVFHKDGKVKSRVDLNHLPPPTLVGDGFIIARPESSSALIYWDGKRFSLYWQSD